MEEATTSEAAEETTSQETSEAVDETANVDQTDEPKSPGYDLSNVPEEARNCS